MNCIVKIDTGMVDSFNKKTVTAILVQTIHLVRSSECSVQMPKRAEFLKPVFLLVVNGIYLALKRSFDSTSVLPDI